MKTSSACSHFGKLTGWIVGLSFLCLHLQSASAARLGNIVPVTTSIQAAINVAQDGDTISIPAGLYIENLLVDKSLTLAALPGPGGNSAAIWANGNQRIITVQPGHDLILKDLVLTGGFQNDPGTNEGGAVYIENGTLTIDHCYIYFNKGNYGGAIRQKGTGSVIAQNDSHIYNNHATIDGGGIHADGSLQMTSFNLEYNEAGRHGGGASVGNNFTALQGVITGNLANQNGGGVNVNNNISADHVNFVDNTAGADGGGILQWNGFNSLSVMINNSTFDGNQAGLTGGAISVYNGAVTTIRESQFTNNSVENSTTTDSKGGAVYFSDASWGHDITINKTSFSGNSSECSLCSRPAGGGLFASTYAPGAVNLDDDTFINNNGWLGGGIFANATKINRVTFQGNTGGSGGGAYLTGTSQILKSSFLQNSVTNNGGGLVVEPSAPSLSIEDTKYIGNAGGYDLGGAIYANAQIIAMKNVAVVDTEVLHGGAIMLNYVGSSIELFHVTVNDTHLHDGSRTGVFGIHLKGPQIVNIFNSMITNQGTGVKIDSSSACSLYNTLWYGNSKNIDGAAGSYADYYPITSNPAYAVDRYHLTSSSGAINHGVDRMVYHDIDGEPRVGLPDIGADEFLKYVFVPQIVR